MIERIDNLIVVIWVDIGDMFITDAVGVWVQQPDPLALVTNELLAVSRNGTWADSEVIADLYRDTPDIYELL